jgi:metallophosphoesterase (TIGR00282 family)
VPGRGYVVHNGIGVLNLIGRTFMGITVDCPFRGADSVLEELWAETPIVLVDLHAEATSEKMAMGFYLDGRVSAVVGTHTHVATADTRLLPKGTAYVSDLGMCGARDAIIGWEIEPITERFLTQLPTRFSPVDKGVAIFNSVMIELDDTTGRATSIQRVDREVQKAEGNDE